MGGTSAARVGGESGGWGIEPVPPRPQTPDGLKTAPPGHKSGASTGGGIGTHIWPPNGGRAEDLSPGRGEELKTAQPELESDADAARSRQTAEGGVPVRPHARRVRSRHRTPRFLPDV